MRIYHLHREQLLPVSLKDAWRFFSSPHNLAQITPPDMGFKVLTNLEDEEIFNGMTIDYIVRPLLRIPLHWQTEIVAVNAPNSFIDRQEKGPYALWEHTHTFEGRVNGTFMIDDVRYALPLGVIGQLAHGLVVRKKLEKIFDYREKRLKELFVEPQIMLTDVVA